LNSSLKNLADHIAEVSAKENKEGIADAVLAGRIILWATLAAILLALGIGFVIARMIAVPLGVMLKDVELVAAGDLSVKRIEMNRRDEVGKLAKAFNQMVDNLHTLVKHVSQASEQVAASSEELTASADQMAKASTQVADSISGVAQGADRQLQSVTDAMAVVEELSAGAEQIAASSSNVAAMSEKTACAAHDGEKAVDVAINKMADIEKTVLNSADMVTGLGNRSKEIGQIVGVISGLASQTNLLALNAAIEAARAGEQGRGFAVVAEEVRKLAEQSQEAAKHIASLIGAIQSDTDKAVTAMNDGTREVKNGAEVVNVAGRAFKEIVASIGEMSQQIREISDAVQQMAQGSEQIVESVRNIDDISKTTAGATQSVSAATEENSATMQEIAASSETLSALAQQLQALVCKFQI
jgi:methyl-accepting chemotaxis protein